MAIEICLIAGISSSYGMEPQLEDEVTSSRLDHRIQSVTDEYLKQHGAKHGFTAVEVSVLLPNETESRNYVAGTVSKESQDPATTEMFVQYGSNTKMFTSSLIIKLIDQKLIQYDTTLHAMFPEKFAEQDSHSWPAAWKSITVKQLLNMTTRIPDFARTQEIWVKLNPYNEYSLNDVINLVANYQKTTPGNEEAGSLQTGTKWNYSNTNYCILGLAVEKYYKMSFAEAMNQYILKPFHEKGMAIYYDLKSLKEVQPKGLHGYFEFSEFARNSYVFLGKDVDDIPLYWTQSAGAMSGTASGLAYIGKALFHNQIISTDVLTAPHNILDTETAKPISDVKEECRKMCFGLGVGLKFEPGFGTVYQYQGGTFGFTTFFNWFSEKDVVVVISQNSSSDTSDLAAPKHLIYKHIDEYLKSQIRKR